MVPSADSIKRVPSGIPGLDRALAGGVPKNSSTILYGTPGVGKSILCQRFLFEGLKRGESCIFMTLDVRPDTILESMKRFGWNSQKRGEIIFFDCFSYRISTQAPAKFAATGLSDLNQLVMILEDILGTLKGRPKRLVIDSLSTLFLYSDPELAPKFLKDFLADAISENATVLMTVEEGIHDSQTVAMLNYLADGFIEMKFDMDRRFLKIAKMQKTEVRREWMEFDITKRGIAIF